MLEFNKLTSKLKSSILLHVAGVLLCLSVFFYLVFNFISWSCQRVTDGAPRVVPVDPYEAHFNRYLKSFGKQYEEREYRRRLDNFKRSWSEMEIMNIDHDEPIFGWTKFSDMTPDEFEHEILLPSGAFGECVDVELSCDHGETTTDAKLARNDTPIPAKFDWRDHNVVGPVLDQGLCLSCWAFSVVGVMESMLLITNQTRLYQRLSIQELVDCSRYTKRCAGGNPSKALKFLCLEPLAIIPEKQYPLTNKNENCRIAPQKSYSGITISNMVVKCDMEVEEIARLVATHGPVVAGVQVRSWQNYVSGVIRYHCSGNWEYVKHVVQIVGYDMTAEVPYFILRNSWGTDFGENGYLRVAMEGFLCGIGRQISYFDVTKININGSVG